MMPKSLIIILLTTATCLISFAARSQETYPITGNFVQLPFKEFIKQIEAKTPYTFYFNADQFDTIKVNFNANDIPLFTLLEKVLAGTPYYYLSGNDFSIYFLDKKQS